jgi:hypothetical protein
MPNQKNTVLLGVDHSGSEGDLEKLEHNHEDWISSPQSGWLWRLMSQALIGIAVGVLPLVLFLVGPADVRDAVMAVTAPYALLVTCSLCAAAQIAWKLITRKGNAG